MSKTVDACLRGGVVVRCCWAGGACVVDDVGVVDTDALPVLEHLIGGAVL